MNSNEKSQPWQAWSRHLAIPLLTAGLIACGGGNSSEDSLTQDQNQTAEQGELMVALTDAEGSFSAYAVDVLSVKMIKANGTEVETVPLSSRMNFADYTDVTEFFTVATIPEGTYTSASLTLDYTDADIIVEDENEQFYEAQVQDVNGDPITQMTMSVSFGTDEPVVIKKGVPAAVTLDFDLEASNTIESFEPALVTVEPVLIADPKLDVDREHRVRGMLLSVDTENNQFEVDLLPLWHRQQEEANNFGYGTVNVVEATHYEIDGVTYEGAAGLAQMAIITEEVPVVTSGHFNSDFQFQADEVYVGSSVPWSSYDVVKGMVISRTGDTLTIRGRTIDKETGSVAFNQNITLNVADTTLVTQQALSNDGLNKDSISIGQRVLAFGELSGGETGDFVLDATEGRVRMNMNLIKGEVLSVDPLVLDVRWMNGRLPALFDFAGTGVTEEDDADANNYEIDTSTLTLDSLEVPDLVKVRGMVNAFGAAPMDFNAVTVIDINMEQRAGEMSVLWPFPEEADAIASATAEQIDLNLELAYYQVSMAGIPLKFTADEEPSIIVPAAPEGTGIYTIHEHRQNGTQVFNNFANYTTAINARIAEGQNVKKVFSIGRYDTETNTMHATSVKTVFVD